MKNLLGATCVLHLLALVLGDGYGQNIPNSNNAKILEYQFDNIGTGPYRFAFSTSDGTQRIEEGNLINANTENEALVVSGSYSYVGPDGVTYSVKYTADENGFHPEGDHIQVPPFVPWNKHQHGDEHGDHSGHYQHTTEPQKPIYLPAEQRPLRPLRPFKPFGSSPDFASNTNLRPSTQYIPSPQRPLGSNLRPAFSQVASSTIKPQTAVNIEPSKLTYLPTRRDAPEENEDEESSPGQSSNIANSILEILSENEEKDEKGSSTVKIEDINAL